MALAGRSWKTKHLDWKRRIAYVEPTDEKGRSRWLGEGQMLSHAVCQSIRRILATESNDPAWSRRAVQKFDELRDEHPWVSADSTCLVRQASGKVRWWTFPGGIANNLLADALKPNFDVKGDNLAVHFMATPLLDAIAERIDELKVEPIKPIPNLEAMENLKFSECLSPEIASTVFLSRFSDPAALGQAIEEQVRHAFC